jgi:hypothetical protein
MHYITVETKLLMIKNLAFFLLLTVFTLTVSCKKTYENQLSPVVINELMPVNTNTVADNYGEFDDWVELYNKSAVTIDLSGYYLSDNHKKPTKWRIPQGTNIAGNDYLIIWCDGDSLQYGLHTNFKLSSAGEEAVLTNPGETIMDKIKFPAPTEELSYSRVPNGTGSFRWQIPTFNRSNGSN